MKKNVAIAALGLALSSPNALAQMPAFPGALGHGANATGGRGGTVYRVTTLANSGAGSFRDAVSQPNRIIIFEVGGYITLSSEVGVSRNITIAGQTAPGGGIAIRGAEVSLGTATNIIIRHVRFRPGSSADSGAHCVNIRGTNVILDQLEFGPWNNVGGVGANLLTIMRSLIADPIGQQFGAHMERLVAGCTLYQTSLPTATTANRSPRSRPSSSTTSSTTTANDFYQIGGNQSLYESSNFRDSVLNGSGTSRRVGVHTLLLRNHRRL